jgi:ABC-type multidrug transport system ATPase subunit
MQSVIVENIVKTYRIKKTVVDALKGISFTVDKGEIFGIIGPDGGGKTSLFRILTTLLLADSGKASVDGFDVVKDYKQIRSGVGYMPGRFSLYQDLSVKENLEFFATIFNTSIKENYDLIKEIYQQIEPFKTRKAGQLSGGMKQKLALCCALIHKPSVLFLDEPTTGVDAVSRKEFWEMLHRLKAQGITILVSTPYMDEAGLCDRVALIQKGEILSINTPKGITRQFGKPLWSVKANEMFRLMNAIKEDIDVESCYPFGQYHHVVFKSQENVKQKLEEIARNGNYTDFETHLIEPNIEDCFMALMKE